MHHLLKELFKQEAIRLTQLYAFPKIHHLWDFGTFGRGESLTRHLVTCHTNALPFSKALCNHCENKLSRKSRLAKHMLIVLKAIHPSKPLNCKTDIWP